MIKENEIRVGNWFEHLPEWSYRNENSVKYLFKWEQRDWYQLGECTIFIESINPIVLTPAILIKCGYKRSGNYFTNRLTTGNIDTVNGADMYIETYGDISFVFNVCCDYYNGYSVNIKYLHELQNLYFSLTKEELTFKP